jgi:hypothetical protein
VPGARGGQVRFLNEARLLLLNLSLFSKATNARDGKMGNEKCHIEHFQTI